MAYSVDVTQGEGFWGEGEFDGPDQRPQESIFFNDDPHQAQPPPQPRQAPPQQAWPDGQVRRPQQTGGGLLPDQTSQWVRDEQGGDYDQGDYDQGGYGQGGLGGRGGFGGRGGDGDGRSLIWFLIAAVAVAIIGAGYAGYTVLNNSGGELEAGTTTTVDPALTTTTTTIPTTTTTAAPPPGLQVELLSNGFVCDGTVQNLGTLTGADPNEEIQFTSPQSSNIRPGVADELGNLSFRWVCDAGQVGTNWFITVTGAISGKNATFSFLGVATAEEAAAVSPEQAGAINVEELGPLNVTVSENPFNCDGEPRDFATLTGALPSAQIDFDSAQATGLRPGTADADGNLTIRWQCLPEQAGTVWEISATEASTERTVSFTFIGR